MTPQQAVAFVRKHGVVLESASGPVPSLAQAVAGAPIRGNWWAHAKSHEIFALTRAVRDSDDVLVCRLVDGKITYVHRRLWAPLVRIAQRFPRKRLAQVHEIHTASGRHVTKEVAFPRWVPGDISAEAGATLGRGGSSSRGRVHRTKVDCQLITTSSPARRATEIDATEALRSE